MNQFLKFVLASCLGVFLAALVVIILGSISLAGLMSSEENVEIKQKTILEVKLEGNVPDLTDNAEKSPFQSDKITGLQDMIAALQHAASDNNIEGILVNTRFIMSGMSSASELRNALLDFKKSGKFVYAYADFMSQGGYLLASTADSIVLNPNGDIDFRGFGTVIPFMKGLFDKIDLKWQIYYAGQYKSATEPLRLDKMSDQNRLQLHEYMNGMFENYIADISKSRNIPAADLKNMSNNYTVRTADDAVKARLVDKKGYYDEVLNMIRAKLGLKEKDKINSMSLSEYAQHYEKPSNTAKDKIAVVYAEGDIDYNDMQENDGVTEGLRYAKIIRKIRQDKNVKAIVLRVNSGGGSSFASDIIWRELDLARKQGIPVISSFGTYAASGGYYIAMASDSIFAEKNTLTGSIGVFGAIPSLESTMKNKLGINFDTVKTGKYSVEFGTTFDHTPEEARILQISIDSIYEQFLNRVATNRKMTRDQVHAIAQGRIWMAQKAKEIGLVDQIGNLNDAIAAAARKAGISDYKKVEYPKFKNGFDKLMEEITGKKSEDIAKTAIKAEMGEFYSYYEHFKKMKEMKGPQMRLPYYIHMK